MHPVLPAFFPLPAGTGPILTDLSLALYILSLVVLLVAASQGVVLLWLHARHRPVPASCPPLTEDLPAVTVQLPVYNERHVVERLIRAVCALDYPKHLLEIQVLDDSTDDTVRIVSMLVSEQAAAGHDIRQVRRHSRHGFKAGALAEGLARARGTFIAIFDADFVPHPEFLRQTLPAFSDPAVGMVQTRWEHMNETYSLLTRTQAFVFDGHFGMDQHVRSAAGQFLTFNGTGGIWRRAAIEDAGGWQTDTLTEDLDLSYRAQLRGWRLVFRNDLTSPAELPVDFNSLRAQQYRWTRGYIETARKVLPFVWRSALPLPTKLLSTLHLSANMAFPFILLVGLLNLPIAVIRSAGAHDTLFLLLSAFILAFLCTFAFHVQAQRVMHRDWLRRMGTYPLFLAGTMGLAVSNTKAVLDGLLRRPGTFVRTPKYALHARSDAWSRSEYAPSRVDRLVAVEILLALYCFFGVVFSLYQLDFLAVPFQLLFASGFALVAAMSIRHARLAGRHTRPIRHSWT